MAIFLIKSEESTHPDPIKDALRYKIGDIVEVFEDTKPCIIPPAPPFWIVKITGITKTQALKYMNAVMETVVDANTGEVSQKMVKRRLYRLSWDLIPDQVKTALLNNRYFETSYNTAKKYIQNKITMDTE